MHPNILSEEQKEILPFIKSFSKEFYLVGGTAISLQIGHRQSIDFDLFKYSSFSKTKIANKLKEFGLTYRLIFTDSESFHIITNGVKVTFFQFPFKIQSKQSFEGIPLPDLLSLAAMKAYALGRRSKWKDYVDLYFLIKFHFDIETISDKAKTIFGELFTAKLFRQQLCYFKDIDYTEEVSFFQEFEVTEDEIKDFLIDISTKSLL
jgi:hypothetical protein